MAGLGRRIWVCFASSKQNVHRVLLGAIRPTLLAALHSHTHCDQDRQAQQQQTRDSLGLRPHGAMASALLSSIPAPAREYSRPEPPPPTGGAAGSLVTREPPPYGRRAGFVPRRLEDYGDGEKRRPFMAALRCAIAACLPPHALPAPPRAGGAFPEIHVAQYPLDMGRPDKGAGGGAPVGGGGKTLALTVNAEGDINYDAVLNQSKNSQKWLQSTHKALVPKVDELNAGVSCVVQAAASIAGRLAACWMDCWHPCCT